MCFAQALALGIRYRLVPTSHLTRAAPMPDIANFDLNISEPLRSAWTARTQILLDSFERAVGRQLIPRAGQALEDARRLYSAPFAVLSHGTQSDPILDYANRIALDLWQTTPEALIVMPSRLTAEPVLREARERLLKDVATCGFVSGYDGVRISATGRRFLIKNVTIWNLLDANGRPAGQAATFDSWHDMPSDT